MGERDEFILNHKSFESMRPSEKKWSINIKDKAGFAPILTLKPVLYTSFPRPININGSAGTGIWSYYWPAAAHLKLCL